jgi:hypothetical protein
MKTQRRWLGVVIAVIALGVVIAAYANAGEPAAEPGVSGERITDPAAVEAKVASTDLGGQMEEALGDDFGGLWFDRPTRQLHVGVTSSESRHFAEHAAADAGLEENVTETLVRSTWAELLAAQEEWGERMADLFDRAEASTAVRAQDNALEVRLASTVPPARRADLQRVAEASPVKVSFTDTQVPQIRIEDQAKTCGAFAKGKAYCDPTITAGVTIQNLGVLTCTAGPVVIPDAHNTTDTYLLTAGHCIDPGQKGAEGTGKKWYAYPKNSKEELDKISIGEAVEYINSTEADVGVIKVQNAFWMEKGLTPVKPAVAHLTTEESEPKPVTGQQVPIEKTESCISGQESGTICAEIAAYPVHIEGKGLLAEVKTTTQVGDSGGPWYSKASPSIIQGIHVGANLKNGRALFLPLKTALIKLSEKGLKLQLLTEENKERHDC